MLKKTFVIASICGFVATMAFGQSAGISLSASQHDATQPVEITADNLTVQQADNTAEFAGNAKVAQGDLRLGADRIKVFYDSASGTVATINATGSVVFTNGAESAEAQNATFSVASNSIILKGNVLLLQGVNAISGDTMTLDLATNKALVNGNVKTVLVPKN